jgi:uncharacterized protein
MQSVTPATVAVLALELVPAAAFGFASERVAGIVHRWPKLLRIIAPALFASFYLLAAESQHMFRWQWFAFYVVLPIVMAWLMDQATQADPQQRGNWRDALILLALGLAVDLRCFDMAWPDGLRGLGNLLLVDAGLYAFQGVRRLSGMGFDFHLKWSDWKTGLRELAFFAPIVLLLGLALGFIHPHANSAFKVFSFPVVLKPVWTWIGIFIFVAVPEELFFRAWVQNFLERRIGRSAALIAASILFGLSHFNKRNFSGAHFNWRYVLLATIAGIFYGRAWRERRRVPASTITHTCVDWLWSWWF